MKRVWYEIELERIAHGMSGDMKVGDKLILAKVRSQGLAHITKNAFAEVYSKEQYKIRVK